MPSQTRDAVPYASVRVVLSRDRTKQSADVVVGGEVVARLPLLHMQADASADGDCSLTLKLPMALDVDGSTTEFLAWNPEAH